MFVIDKDSAHNDGMFIHFDLNRQQSRFIQLSSTIFSRRLQVLENFKYKNIFSSADPFNPLLLTTSVLSPDSNVLK